jgi:hypothetical protein
MIGNLNMVENSEFKWMYEVKKDSLELNQINSIVKNIQTFTVYQGTKDEAKLVAFSELSGIDDVEIIFMKLDYMEHKLNKLIAAFNFRPEFIELKEVIYKSDAKGTAKKVMDRVFATSGPVTLLTPIDHAFLEMVKDKFSNNISFLIKNDYSDNKDMWSVIEHLAKDDFKEYYIAYETICKAIGIRDGRYDQVSTYSGIAEEQIRSFYITANYHRHKKGKKPPGTPMDFTTAKILILRLFTSWLEHRYKK